MQDNYFDRVNYSKRFGWLRRHCNGTFFLQNYIDKLTIDRAKIQTQTVTSSVSLPKPLRTF